MITYLVSWYGTQNFNFNCTALEMHEQTTIEVDVCIVDKKNLNWCTPFSGVSL